MLRIITLVAIATGLTWVPPAFAAIEQQRAPKAPPAPEQPTLTKAPELLTYNAPAYPPSLLSQSLQGEVLLWLDLDETGRVERAEVSSATHPDFAAAALQAALGLAFTPAEVDGAPSGIRIEFRYVFEPELPEPDAVAGRPSPPTANEGASAEINFLGVVREAGTRLPVPGAVITVNGRPVAESDRDGRFVVRGAPAGDLTVTIARSSYDSYTTDERVREDERLEVSYYLRRKTLNPYETVVRAKAERREVSRVELERKELQKTPGTFGDPIRVIENLPGMARAPLLGGALLVRGATPSSSRVLFDGVEVPFLYHFGGLTSVVNAEFLETINFYAGGFGARYGRATAGVVDVTTRDIDCELVRGVGRLGFGDASLYSCVPLGDWHVAAAVRRSTIDLVLPFVLSQIPREPDEGSLTVSPQYWDYQAKTRTTFGNQSIDLFAFGSYDRLKVIQTGSFEGLDLNLGTTTTFHRLVARHRVRLTEDMSLSSSIAPGYTGQFFTIASGDSESEFRLGVWSIDWREDFTWKLHPAVTLRAGLDHQFGNADFGMRFPFGTDLRRFPSGTFDYTETEEINRMLANFGQGYWLEGTFDLGPVRLVPGVRFERYDFAKTQDFSVQPRLNARWEIVEGTTLKGAYGWYTRLPDPQFIIEGFGNPYLEPEGAHHFVLGLEQAFTDLINLDLQGFYITRESLPVLSAAERYRNGELVRENYASTGTGRSFGLEVLLRHLSAPGQWFYGWLAYTFSRTTNRDHAPGATYALERPDGTIDLGNYSDRSTAEYLAPFDQTHILTLVGQFILPWGIEAGFRFRLVSGNPTTPLDRGRSFFDADLNAYRIDATDVPRNSDRLPLFHQLDLRVERTFTFDLWKLTPFVEVINVYYAKNVETVQYDYRYRERIPVSLLPILPILGVQGEF